MGARIEFATMGLVDHALGEAWRELAAVIARMLPDLGAPAHLVPDPTSAAIVQLSQAMARFPSGRRGSIAERRARAFHAAGVQWLALHGLKCRWKYLAERGDDEQRHARQLTQDAYRHLVLELLPRLRREFQHVKQPAATARWSRQEPKRSQTGGIDWYALPDQYRYRTDNGAFTVLPGMRAILAFEPEPGHLAWHPGVVVAACSGQRASPSRCYIAFDAAGALRAALRDRDEETLLPVAEATRVGVADAHAACDRLEARLRGLDGICAWLQRQIEADRICLPAQHVDSDHNPTGERRRSETESDPASPVPQSCTRGALYQARHHHGVEPLSCLRKKKEG